MTLMLVSGVDDVELGPLEEVELNGLAGRQRICRVHWQAEPIAPPPLEPAAEVGPNAMDDVFRKQADHWEIRYAGKSVRLIDLKGMRDLADLRRQPGRELPSPSSPPSLTRTRRRRRPANGQRRKPRLRWSDCEKQ